MDFFALSEELKKSFDQVVKKKVLIQEETARLNGQKADLELAIKNLQAEVTTILGKKQQLEKSISEESAKHSEVLKTGQAELERQRTEWQQKKDTDIQDLVDKADRLAAREKSIAIKEEEQEQTSQALTKWKSDIEGKSKDLSLQLKKVQSQAKKNQQDSEILATKNLEMITLEKNAKEAIKTIEEVKMREATLSKNEADFAVTKKLYDDRIDKLVQKEAAIAQKLQTLEKKEAELRRREIRLGDREKTLQSNLTNFSA